MTTPNPNAELWFKRLEENRDKQGKGALCEDDMYCCLGVACEVYIEAGNELETNIFRDCGVVVKSYSSQRYFLPTVVMDWLGLRNRAGDSNGNNLSEKPSCTHMNDKKRLTFPKIAEALRKDYDSYFSK